MRQKKALKSCAKGAGSSEPSLVAHVARKLVGSHSIYSISIEITIISEIVVVPLKARNVSDCLEEALSYYIGITS